MRLSDVLLHNVRDERYQKFWDAVIDSPLQMRDYLAATVLVSEVAKQNPDETNPEALFSALLGVCHTEKIDNPFGEAESFYKIYKEAMELPCMDWTEALATDMDLSRKPTVTEALSELFTEHLQAKPGSVLITDAEMFHPYLVRLAKENLSSKFLLTTQSVLYGAALSGLTKDCPNVGVVTADVSSGRFSEDGFDLIISCPVYSAKRFAAGRGSAFRCREYDMVAFENLSARLCPGGSLVIALPARVTFAPGDVEKLRALIQSTYTIRRVSELPEGVLEFTGLKYFLFDIENTEPLFGETELKRYTGERKKKSGVAESLTLSLDISVSFDELTESGEWNVARIFSRREDWFKRYEESSVRKAALGSVCQEMFRGKTVTDRSEDGNFVLVGVSSIGGHEIDLSSAERFREDDERKISNYLLKDGDVVIAARGTAMRAAVFRDPGFSCVASSNVIVLRPKKDALDGTYLKIFLDGDVGRRLLEGAQQGAGILSISYRDLKFMNVPCPDMEEQRRVVKEYEEAYAVYRKAVSDAEEKWRVTLKRLQTYL